MQSFPNYPQCLWSRGFLRSRFKSALVACPRATYPIRRSSSLTERCLTHHDRGPRAPGQRSNRADDKKFGYLLAKAVSPVSTVTRSTSHEQRVSEFGTQPACPQSSQSFGPWPGKPQQVSQWASIFQIIHILTIRGNGFLYPVISLSACPAVLCDIYETLVRRRCSALLRFFHTAVPRIWALRNATFTFRWSPALLLACVDTKLLGFCVPRCRLDVPFAHLVLP